MKKDTKHISELTDILDSLSSLIDNEIQETMSELDRLNNRPDSGFYTPKIESEIVKGPVRVLIAVENADVSRSCICGWKDET